MRLALCAVLLMAPLYGLLGTMVVDGRMSFFSDSLGHSAMTGIALGVLLGLDTPVWAMVAFGVLYALLLVYVKARGAASTDTTLGVFSATGWALGVVLLSRNGGFARYSNYLIGDLLAIEAGDLAAIGAALAATVVFWFAAYNRLLLLCVSPALAAAGACACAGRGLLRLPAGGGGHAVHPLGGHADYQRQAGAAGGRGEKPGPATCGDIMACRCCWRWCAGWSACCFPLPGGRRAARPLCCRWRCAMRCRWRNGGGARNGFGPWARPRPSAAQPGAASCCAADFSATFNLFLNGITRKRGAIMV